MPYDSVDALPAYVKKLPAAKQRQWMHVFNSCSSAGGDEARCFRMANGVVKQASGGEWEPEGEVLDDAYEIALMERAYPFTDVIGGEVIIDTDKLRRQEMRSSSFAYISSDGGRHLPIHDAAHVRNALARFNQTHFESAAAKRAARRKIVAAARRFGIEVSNGSKGGLLSPLRELFGLEDGPLSLVDGEAPPSPGVTGGFAVVKQADGRMRWFARYSNAWLDRDGEILTEEAHKDYVQWVYDNGTFPELWLWHTPGTRVGEADWMDFSDGFAHASGLVDDGKESVIENIKSADLGMSHGFLALQQGKWVRRYRSYELSILPRERAAVETTGFNLMSAMKEEDEIMGFTDERRKWLVDALGEDAVSNLEKSTESMAAELKTLGVEYKQAEEQQAQQQVEQSEGFKVLTEQVTSLTQAVSTLATAVGAQQKELQAVKSQQTKTDDEKIEDAFLARVAKAFGQNGGVTRPTESTTNVKETGDAPAGAQSGQTDFFSQMIGEQLGYLAKSAPGADGTGVGTPAVASASVENGPTEVRGE